LSHDEVKRAVGLFHGFVSAIASAPCSFLYLNNEYLIIKKKKKKKDPSISHDLPTHETSTFVSTQRRHVQRLEILVYKRQPPS